MIIVSPEPQRMPSGGRTRAWPTSRTTRAMSGATPSRSPRNGTASRATHTNSVFWMKAALGALAWARPEKNRMNGMLPPITPTRTTPTQLRRSSDRTSRAAPRPTAAAMRTHSRDGILERRVEGCVGQLLDSEPVEVDRQAADQRGAECEDDPPADARPGWRGTRALRAQCGRSRCSPSIGSMVDVGSGEEPPSRGDERSGSRSRPRSRSCWISAASLTDQPVDDRARRDADPLPDGDVGKEQGRGAPMSTVRGDDGARCVDPDDLTGERDAHAVRPLGRPGPGWRRRGPQTIGSDHGGPDVVDRIEDRRRERRQCRRDQIG